MGKSTNKSEIGEEKSGELEVTKPSPDHEKQQPIEDAKSDNDKQEPIEDGNVDNDKQQPIEDGNVDNYKE